MTELFEHLPGQQAQGPQDGKRGSRRQRKNSRRVRLLALIAGSLAVLVVAALLGVKVFKPLYESWRAPNDYPGPGSGSVNFQIAQGESGSQIASKLAQADIVKNAEAFTAAAAADPKSNSIQPGTYRMKKQMSATGALAALLDKADRISIQVTLPEGLRAADALKRISSATGFSVAQLQAAAKDPSAGLPAAAKGNPEGYLFPATYSFDPTAKPVVVMQQILKAYRQAMAQAGVPAAQQHRILTLASIVQAESGDTKDMPKIARVFTNRLSQGMPLQSDVTVLYANNVKGQVTTTDAMRANKSPYNTYVHPGLPPGPVDSPGLAAIKATYHPAAGPWLYFVAVNPDTGDTRYATTAAEHQRNVEMFQAWLRAHDAKSGN